MDGYFDEKMFDQEQEINKLAEELEELRFNHERRRMDSEELKRVSFELELKVEEY